MTQYALDHLRWCRSMQKVYRLRRNVTLEMNFKSVGDEIERLQKQVIELELKVEFGK